MNTALQSAYHKRKGTGSVRYGLFQPNFAFLHGIPTALPDEGGQHRPA